MVEEFRLHFAKMMQNSCIHISGVHIVTDSNNDIKGTEMLQEVWEIVHMPLLKWLSKLKIVLFMLSKNKYVNEYKKKVLAEGSENSIGAKGEREGEFEMLPAIQ